MHCAQSLVAYCTRPPKSAELAREIEKLNPALNAIFDFINQPEASGDCETRRVGLPGAVAARHKECVQIANAPGASNLRCLNRRQVRAYG